MLNALDDNGVTAFDKIRTDTLKNRVLAFERSLQIDDNNQEDICTDICKMVWSLIFGSGKKKNEQIAL